MNLTLHQIDTTIEMLSDAISDMKQKGEDTKEAERALAEYTVEHLPKKVDAIAGNLRSWKADHTKAVNEIERMQAVAKDLDERITRLKGIAKEVMETREVNKLNGFASTLRLQGNGGPQELEVYDASLLPNRCLARMLVVPEETCQSIINQYTEKGYMSSRDSMLIASGIAHCQIVSNENAIRKELNTVCEACNGKIVECSACGSTGRHLVPGARLKPRGNHVRVENR